MALLNFLWKLLNNTRLANESKGACTLDGLTTDGLRTDANG